MVFDAPNERQQGNKGGTSNTEECGCRSVAVAAWCATNMCHDTARIAGGEWGGISTLVVLKMSHNCLLGLPSVGTTDAPARPYAATLPHTPTMLPHNNFPKTQKGSACLNPEPYRPNIIDIKPYL